MSMARIAVLVSNPCTGDARVLKMARAAAQAGHQVHVFATSGANVSPLEYSQGVNFHRLEWRPSASLQAMWWSRLLRRVSRKLSNGAIKRVTPFVKYALFRRIFSEHVARIRPEIVHAHDLICLPAAYAAARACGAALVYDAHELETHRNPPLPFLQKRVVSHVERKYARKAGAVITVGRLVCQELSAHIGRNDVNVLFNSPGLDPSPRNIRTDLRLHDETPLLLYVGKVTDGRGVGDIITLLPRMPGVMFATVGPCDTRTRNKLEAQAEVLGVASRFRILPPVPFEQVVGYIRGADLGLISVEPVTLSYRYCMPNKLFELSFANVPIIANKLDEIEMYLGEFGNGMVTDFDDKAALPYTIYRMLQSKQQYMLNEEKSALMHEKYSWNVQASKLLSIYDRVLLRGGDR
jgi:glycosyltransferase involved in cell wall biosynthesis